MRPEAILWCYLVLLIVGGVMGFVKGKSRISLISALVFGALIALSASGKLGPAWTGDLILTVLVAMFAWRFQKTKKLMPAGVMTIVTIAALLIRLMM
jgi:uncharacterized membrane protein (UPF0136 family)